MNKKKNLDRSIKIIKKMKTYLNILKKRNIKSYIIKK